MRINKTHSTVKIVPFAWCVCVSESFIFSVSWRVYRFYFEAYGRCCFSHLQLLVVGSFTWECWLCAAKSLSSKAKFSSISYITHIPRNRWVISFPSHFKRISKQHRKWANSLSTAVVFLTLKTASDDCEDVRSLFRWGKRNGSLSLTHAAAHLSSWDSHRFKFCMCR